MPATPRRSSENGTLGNEPQSLPTAHGFDEFYGIPPDICWDSATYMETIALTHSINAPYETLLKTGPQIVEAKAGGPLQTVKPFTEEVRANIDNELVDKSIDFMRRQKAAGKPSSSTCRSPWDTHRTCLRRSSRESRGSATTATS